MFDLDSLSFSQDTFALRLLHPVLDTPLGTDAEPVVAHIYGTASDAYRDASNQLQLKRAARGNKKVSQAEQLKEAMELLVAVTARLENMAYQGKPVASRAEISALYNDPKMSWVPDQIAQALNTPANFLKS